MKRCLALLPLVVLLGCGAETDTAPPAPSCADEAPVPTVTWKRTHVLVSDLSRGLELEPAEVCLELGTQACAEVHRVALGSSDPFDKALYAPFAEPLATTPLASERVVLAACVARVTQDRSAQPKLFTSMDLEADSVVDSGPNSAFARDVTALGKRLLGRGLSAEELATLAELTRNDAGEPIKASDAAVLACFTVGTSREFLFL